MSELICMAFKGFDTADHVLAELQGMQKEYLVDMEDSCIVTRDDQGKIKLKQALNLVTGGAISGGSWGSLWGLLVGWLFANPLAGFLGGAALGAGAGAVSGALSDYGIDDDFIKRLGSEIEPGSSALFVLVAKANEDRVLPELSKYEGRLLKTSLTDEQEAKLKEALKAAA